MSEQKELIVFDWIVHDKCNFSCEYCVNGIYKNKAQKSIYDSKKDIEIAKQLVEVSKFCKKLKVTFSGGEPLLSENISKIIDILATRKNIEIDLITNFKLINKIKHEIDKLYTIVISLHIKYRSNEEVNEIIDFINENKKTNPENKKPKISITQVNYELNDDDRRKLALITEKTGFKIVYQVYIPPKTQEKANINLEETSIAESNPLDNFISTLGKRCSLGVIYFLLNPDAKFRHSLWCNGKYTKIDDFLRPIEELKHLFLSKDMKKCPSIYCGCNYNTFNYKAYLNTCQQMKYPEDEIFPRSNFTKKAKEELIL